MRLKIIQYFLRHFLIFIFNVKTIVSIFDQNEINYYILPVETNTPCTECCACFSCVHISYKHHYITIIKEYHAMWITLRNGNSNRLLITKLVFLNNKETQITLYTNRAYEISKKLHKVQIVGTFILINHNNTEVYSSNNDNML